MSLDFTAGTDRRVFSPAFTVGPAFSWGAWVYPTSMGPGDIGAVYGHGGRSTLGWNGIAASNKLRFTSGRVTTNGGWEQTTGYVTLPRWRWVGMTYDGGNVANHPTFYNLDRNRVWTVYTNGAGLTRLAAPVGAQQSDGTLIRLGNDYSLVSQFIGYLAHACLYSRILTESEMRLLAEDGPRRRPRGLVLSWPGRRLPCADESGNGLTGVAGGTGTAIAETEDPPARW